MTEEDVLGLSDVIAGPEVNGKYSADLFVKRAVSIFHQHRKMEESGRGRPWFTYLSFQSVHDPLQVPHNYKKNVCNYKDTSRYFYSAMVSSLDHSVDRVIQGLKATGFYENTIIAFTTDNGGAVNMGGNNWPLRGTKGTLFEELMTKCLPTGEFILICREGPAAWHSSTPRCCGGRDTPAST